MAGKIHITAVLAAFMALGFTMSVYAAGKSAVMIVPEGTDKTEASALLAESEASGEDSSDTPDYGDAAVEALSVSDTLCDSNGLPVDSINVPDDAVVLVVLGEDASAHMGTLEVFARNPGVDGTYSAWESVLVTEAATGENGLYKTVEGDKKTPVGIFLMNTPFGIAAAEEGFPEDYLQVTDTHYWNGDSGSGLYNRLVDSSVYSDFSTSGSEHLIEYTEYYDYCLDTGYNPEGTPHLGSAIFLHCRVAGDDDTGGCIAIPSEDMITVLRLYEPGTSYMVIYDVADMAAVMK